MTSAEWAAKLHAAVPWIPAIVFQAWAQLENPDPSLNNPLGISQNNVPTRFATPDAGVAATASLLSSSMYASIKQTSQTTGGDPVKIMWAIAQSPWNPDHTGYYEKLAGVYDSIVHGDASPAGALGDVGNGIGNAFSGLGSGVYDATIGKVQSTISGIISGSLPIVLLSLGFLIALVFLFLSLRGQAMTGAAA